MITPRLQQWNNLMGEAKINADAARKYQHDVVTEMTQLQGRVDKLKDFLQTDTFIQNIPYAEKIRIIMQLGFMEATLLCLKDRIVHFPEAPPAAAPADRAKPFSRPDGDKE